MDMHKTEAARATEDIAAAAGVPPTRTADEQKRYDSLSPADKQADDDKRQALARTLARTMALAALPNRTDAEQKAYDAMSPAERTADDEKRLSAAHSAAVRPETPEGRAARESHEQAMAGSRAADKKATS